MDAQVSDGFQPPHVTAMSAAPLAARDALSHREKRIIALSMMLPVFLGSVDQSIMATALPTIGRVFNNMHDLPWVVTSYLIAATALTPLYGKFADIYGRRATLLIALSIYMSGAVISASSQSLLMLILGRVVQGAGGGGIDRDGSDGARGYRGPKRSRQILHLFFDCLHDRRRMWTGAGRLDLRSSLMVDDLYLEDFNMHHGGHFGFDDVASAAVSRASASTGFHRCGVDHGGKLLLHVGP